MNGYRMMWAIVLFDLPVVEQKQRKEATEFRKFLLDNGFHMSQYSVYYRLLSGKDALKTIVEMVEDALPKGGKVDIISITDKQYENIVSFYGKEFQKQKKTNAQFLLF